MSHNFYNSQTGPSERYRYASQAVDVLFSLGKHNHIIDNLRLYLLGHKINENDENRVLTQIDWVIDYENPRWLNLIQMILQNVNTYDSGIPISVATRARFARRCVYRMADDPEVRSALRQIMANVILSPDYLTVENWRQGMIEYLNDSDHIGELTSIQQVIEHLNEFDYTNIMINHMTDGSVSAQASHTIPALTELANRKIDHAINIEYDNFVAEIQEDYDARKRMREKFAAKGIDFGGAGNWRG